MPRHAERIRDIAMIQGGEAGFWICSNVAEPSCESSELQRIAGLDAVPSRRRLISLEAARDKKCGEDKGNK